MLVSCIIPTFKRNDYLLKAIQSVINQTYENLEIIIVDDNNPNDSYSIQVQKVISGFNDHRIKYVQQEKHSNGAVARNLGISISKGEFIAFLDDDDEWLPEKIEKQLSYLRRKGNGIGAVSCLAEIYMNNQLIRRSVPYNNVELHKHVLSRNISIFTPTILFKRSELLKTKCFNPKLTRHQDLQLILDFLVVSNIHVMTEYLVKINVDDKINRPNSIDFIKIKGEFFKLMTSHFEHYSKKEKREIISMHYFEIIFVLLKEKRYYKAIVYLLKIRFSRNVYQNLRNRYKSRKYLG